MKTKAVEISDARIEELSLVFANKDGVEFAPRNGNARVLSVKGAEAKPSFLDRFAQTLKGYFVANDTPDTIDGDGDGAEDYEQILFAISAMGSDLQSAMWMSDPKMRSAAIVAGVDSFLAQIDSIRSGGNGYDASKAGARHSKADTERLDAMKGHLDKIGAHADKMASMASDAKDATKDDDAKDNFAKMGSRADSIKKHVDAANALHDEMMPKSQSNDGSTDEDNGEKGGTKAAVVTPPTTETATPPAAAEPAATNEPAVNGAKAGEVDMTQEQIDALVASAATKAAEAAVAATTAAFKPQLDAATAKAATAEAAVAEANRLAAEAKAQADALTGKALQRTATGAAPGQSATGPDPESRLQRTIKAHLSSAVTHVI